MCSYALSITLKFVDFVKSHWTFGSTCIIMDYIFTSFNWSIHLGSSTFQNELFKHVLFLLKMVLKLC